nr:Chain C, SAGA-associated factor 11 [Saccharomyces cerevisiae S288C]4FIP_G Chain G, SAGA-associated factor 11 [Saccharomyces cerevisiae S288C]
MTEETITIDSISNGILNNLLTTLIQDIVARETTQQQLLKTRYPDLRSYYFDPNGSLDINGLQKQQESSQYIH